jgi:hypothetical protein
MAMSLEDQSELLDMVLDRLRTGHDPRLVAQQSPPRVFGRPRFARWIMPDGKAEKGKARGSLWDGQGVGNARLTGFQFQPSFPQPAPHQLLALPHDLFVAMQDHDIVGIANDAGGIKSRASVAAKSCPDKRF